MLIIPAVDLLDGKCVRLYQGDYERAEKVANDPVETAKRFLDEGAARLHVVDLDGARDGRQRNFKILEKLCGLGLKVQTGGGIRDMQSVRGCFSAGVSYVIIGSAAVTDREFLQNALSVYSDRIIAGVDAKDGEVKISGWLEKSGKNYIDLSKELARAGVKTIIYTDISRDGTLSGPDLAGISALKKAVGCDIVASGGIKDMSDVKALCDIGAYGAILGKSIYSGSISLADALKIAQSRV